MKLTFKQTAFAALASVALVLGVGSAFFPGFNSNLVMSKAVNGDLVGHTIIFTRGSDSHCSYPSGSGTYVTGKQLPGDTYVYMNMDDSLYSTELGKLRSNNGTILKFTKDKAGSIEFLFQSINSISIRTPNYRSGGFDITIQYSTNGKTFNNYATRLSDSSADLERTISAGTLSSDPIKMIRVLNSNTNSESLNLNQVTLNIDCSYNYIETVSTIESVSLDKAEKTLVDGTNFTLTPTVTGTGPFDNRVIWTSSNDSVASVSNGVVTAEAVGTATITATSIEDNTKYDTCSIKVVDTISSIAVKTGKNSYSVGDTFDPSNLVITVTYSSASSEDVAYIGHQDDFSFSPDLSTELESTDDTIEITYLGSSCDYSITVSDTSGIVLSGIYRTNTSSYGTTYAYIDFDSKKYYFDNNNFIYFEYEIDLSGNMSFTHISDSGTISGSTRRLFYDNSTDNTTGVYTEASDSFTIKLYYTFSGEKSASYTFTKQ